MVKGHCPSCEQLVEITPTPVPVGETGTARRWKISLHYIESIMHGSIEVVQSCKGSGRLI